MLCFLWIQYTAQWIVLIIFLEMKKYTKVYEKCLERITTNYKWEQSVTFIDLGGSGKLEGYLGNRSLDLS